MGYPKLNPFTPAAAAGVKGVIAGRARSRRETQRALNEIEAHARRPRRNDLAPRLRLEMRALESLRGAAGAAPRRETEREARGKRRKIRPVPTDPDRRRRDDYRRPRPVGGRQKARRLGRALSRRVGLAVWPVAE